MNGQIKLRPGKPAAMTNQHAPMCMFNHSPLFFSSNIVSAAFVHICAFLHADMLLKVSKQPVIGLIKVSMKILFLEVISSGRCP